MAVFLCPSCEISKQVPDKHLGKAIACPKCGANVEIVADKVAVPEPLQESEAAVPEQAQVPEPSIESVDLSDLAEAPVPEEQPLPPTAGATTAEEFTIQVKSAAIDTRGGVFQGSLLGNLAAGLLLGVLTFFFSLAFSLLVFPGAEGQAYAFAVSMALTAGAVTCVVTALGSGFPVAIAGPESAAGAILFLMVGRLSAGLGGVGAESAFPTLAAGVALSAAVTGLALIAVSMARTGAWIRFIPYQVIGGVMAGIGFLVLKGVYVFSMGGEPCFEMGREFLGSAMLTRLGPAVGFGLLLFFTRRFFKYPLVLPAIILAAVGAGNAAMQFGLLPGVGYETCAMRSMQPFAFWRMYDPSFLKSVRWDLLYEALPYAFGLIGVVMASLMLKVTGLELSASTESTMDRELKAVGAGSLISGLVGGMPGSLSKGRSMDARRFGARGPLAGIISGLVCALGLVAAPWVLPYIPWFVPAGMLVFMGLGLLWGWLVKTRSEFSQPGDYATLFLIFLLIVTLGFLLGVAVGVAVAMMLIVGRYGGLDVVRNVLYGDHHRSNVDRAPSQLRILHQKGGRIMIMRLQGFLFLGTTNSLIRRIRKRAVDREHEPLRYIILDFTRISGLDSSVNMSFSKLRNVAGEYGVSLIFTNVPFEMEQELEAAGCVLNAPDQGSRTFVSVDYAMEWCENHILESEGAVLDDAGNLADVLKPVFPETKYIPMLMKVMKKVEVKEGDHVFRQGDASDAMYFIEKGMISIRLELEGGRLLRLKKMRPGTVFGEMGIYTSAPRSASAVAAEDCRLYRLSKSTLEKMQAVNPQFTSAVHRFIVNLLAERVAEANTSLRDLLK